MAVVRIRSVDGELRASLSGCEDRRLEEQDATWLTSTKLAPAAISSKGAKVHRGLLAPILEMVTTTEGQFRSEGDPAAPYPLQLFVHCEDAAAARQPFEAALLPETGQFVGCSRTTIMRAPAVISSDDLWRPRTLPSVHILNAIPDDDTLAPAAARVVTTIDEVSRRHEVSTLYTAIRSIDDLSDLTAGSHAVVHLIAHGADGTPERRGAFVHLGSTVVAVEDAARELSRLGAALVVLTVCHSANPELSGSGVSLADLLVAEGVGAVVASRQALEDTLAVTAAERLYEALWDGKPVDSAVNAARSVATIAAQQSALLTLHVGTRVLHTPFGDASRRRDALDAGRRLFKPPPPPMSGDQRVNPSVLLNPWYRVVPLVGRDDELDELDVWRELTTHVSVRAIVGDGGSGKTRLALHHIDRTNQRRGWTAGFLAADIEPVATLASMFGDVELVIDYAESSRGSHFTVGGADHKVSHRSIVVKLIEAAHRRPGKTRLLLCLRQRPAWGSWLSAFCEDSIAHEIADAEDHLIDLGPTGDRKFDGDELFRQATHRLADECNRATPARRSSKEKFALGVCCDALLAVLDGDQGAAHPALNRVLDHQRRYWERSDGAPPDQAIRDEAMLTALFVGLDQCRLESALDRLQIGDGSTSTRQLATWCQTMSSYGQAIQPDKLAELFVLDASNRLARDRPDRMLLAHLVELTLSLPDHQLAGTVALWSRVSSSPWFDRQHPLNHALAAHWLELCHRLIGVDGITTTFSALCQAIQIDIDQANAAMARLPAPVTRSSAAVEIGLRELRYCIAREVLGDRHPDTLTSLNNLAVRYETLGHAQRAMPLFEHCHQQSCDVLGDHHPDTLTSLNNLASCYREAGEASRALPLQEDCYQRRRQVLGHDHPDTLTSLGELASCYQAVGHAQRALPIHQECYQKSREVRGDHHPATVTILNNLAGCYLAVGDTKRALSLHEDIYRHRRDRAGDHHPDTVTSLNNLAACYLAGGDAARALPLFEDCYEHLRKLLGDHHPKTIVGLNSLAGCLLSVGEVDRARTLCEDCVRSSREVLGDHHPITLNNLNDLANCCLASGHVNVALTLYQDIYQQRCEELGEHHPDTLTSLNNLAHCYQTVGDPRRALPLYEATYQQTLKALGEHHPDTLGSLNNLAGCYQATGDAVRALSLKENCYRQRCEVLGAHHPDTLGSLSNLAICYQAVGDVQRALPLHEETYRRMREILGDRHPSTLTSLNNLAHCYQSTGDASRALSLHESCYDLRRDVLGEHHPDTLNSLDGVRTNQPHHRHRGLMATRLMRLWRPPFRQ